MQIPGLDRVAVFPQTRPASHFVVWEDALPASPLFVAVRKQNQPEPSGAGDLIAGFWQPGQPAVRLPTPALQAPEEGPILGRQPLFHPSPPPHHETHLHPWRPPW